MVWLDVELLVDRFFFFFYYFVSTYCFLVSMVSNDKLAVILIKDPLYIVSLFSFSDFKIL